GQVEEGFRHLDDSYWAAREGGHLFQTSNAVYNAVWIAVHLGRGRVAKEWTERIAGTEVSSVDAWPYYSHALVELHLGHVREVVDLARKAVQRARESGHEKLLWRGSVLLAHVLAESLLPEQALAELPA